MRTEDCWCTRDTGHDIGVNITFTIKLFADDCLLYRRIDEPSDSSQLHHDLNRLTEWSKTWMMRFNTKKCATITITNKKKILAPSQQYHIQGITLQEVREANYLGVTIANTLGWKKQINRTVAKANTILHFLRRNLNRCNTAVWERAYLTLVRPVLEYASATWNPHYDCDIRRVEMCQRTAARFVLKDHSRLSSVQNLLDKLEWPTLERRRANSRLIQFYNAVNQNSGLQIPAYIQASVRDPTKFIQPCCRTNLHLHSYFPRTVKQWNSLEQRSLPSINLFKTFITNL